MPATVTRSQGKTMFVKEVLLDNSRANAQVVNEAWRNAGMDGSISATLVSQVRSQMGLTGNSRRGGRGRSQVATTANGRPGAGRRPKPAGAESNGAAPKNAHGRKDVLTHLEVDLDRLLSRVMDVGDLLEVEDALRKARRLLYTSLGGGS